MTRLLNSSEIDLVVVRVMESDEFEVMRKVSVAALDSDAAYGASSTPSRTLGCGDSLSFVAILSDQIVGQALYLHAVLDAPRSLVDVLLSSPVGVLPDV